MLSLTFNLKSDDKKFHSNIIKNEELFQAKKEQIQITKSSKIENFIQNYKLTQKNKSMFYGYPLYIDSNGDVSPIFFIEIFLEEKDNNIIFTKESVTPEFNHHILKKNGFQIEEIEKIQIELEEEDNFIIKLEKVLELLHIKNENISPTLQTCKLELKPVQHLANKVMIYFGERTGITKGLIVELQKLKKISYHQIKSSSLGHFLDYKSDSKNQRIDKPLLEIFEMNHSQGKSVLNALEKPITVITGPPGTGKSQVVLNIIANAVYNDKTILFSSKNNRAVDVVLDKLHSILSHDLVIRMGTRRHRRTAKLEIEKLLYGKDTLELLKDNNKKIELLNDINQEIKSINMNLDSMSELNNRIDNSKNEIDILAKQLPLDLFFLCREDSYSHIDKFRLEGEIENVFANTEGIIRKILKLLFPRMYIKRQQRLFNEYYDKMPPPFKKYLDRNIISEKDDFKKALEWILTFKIMDILQEDITSASKELTEFPSIFDLFEKVAELHEKRVKLSRPLFEDYWNRKIKGINVEKHNSVSRYFDVSEKLEKYIESYNLWKELDSNQKKEMDEILSFLPVWVVTNLSTKNSFPLKNRLFDLLVIDEASQCDIASALPLLYRAKHVVIIGDPKQLKHISLIRESQDKRIASFENVDKLFLDFSYSKNSLYDLAERTIIDRNELPILLNEHYRSHRDIITFSNEFFYENKLNIHTDENKLISNKYVKKRVSWIDVKGKTIRFKSSYCIEEADEIINVLKKLQRLDVNNISIGIVTLFKAQMDLIIDKIKRHNLFEINNVDVTVGTTHRFQGDEKDIIIFSPAVSDGIKQKTINWIHSTNQLINVAITRARSELIIVGNKKICSEAGGVLKELVDYIDTKKESEIIFDSNMEERFYNSLKMNNIKVIPQYWVRVKDTKPYRLDFALFINNNRYDIEIDGDKSHSKKDDYDILRDIHLRMEGWKVRRFQSSNINNNLSDVIDQINRFC